MTTLDHKDKTPSPAQAENLAQSKPEKTSPPVSETETLSVKNPSTTREPDLFDEIVAVLKTVNDPEIPVNIYDLGLIYNIDIQPEGTVAIDMTLTSPNCPVAIDLPEQVQETVESVEGVRRVTINLVWDPPWDRARMSDDAMMILGFY